MRGISSYNIMTRKLNISNPFQFISELKYHSEEEVFDSINNVMDYRTLEELYETVLRTASNNVSTWSALIDNKIGIKSVHYLNDLNRCLKTLVTSKHIECNYRTKFNAHKDILALKIVELNLLDNGRKTLDEIDLLSKVDSEELLLKCIHACSMYARDLDILSISRDELVDSLRTACQSVSDINILEFDKESHRGLVFNYYEGQFIVRDFKKFKEFVDLYDNFKLEKILSEFFSESAFRNMELKIIINALKSNGFESVYTFIREDKILDYLNYLTNMEYIRLDYSYKDVGPLQQDLDLKIHGFKMTELGENFFNSDSVIRLREQSFLMNECVKDFKKGTKEKQYKAYFDKLYYMRNLIIFEDVD
ncbi:hypothetical protein EZV73_26525 [Acidaminobacter sp. JC074]|uniref:hypothetical protein n=1 Tax=Acidaminobacter sp. JC074 TaxID=2530199 RepID=UPI001F0D8752|nr:hypothetical protein [Acidaminobacter sp. JC074]MCH4891162.1 hypothetical protein [Acidaminobacter sp. JC074]